LDTTPVAGSSDQFYRDVAMSTVSLFIPSVNTGYYVDQEVQRVDAIAWGILSGILNLEGFHPPTVTLFDVRESNGSPVPGAAAVLSETLVRHTDRSGRVNFLGLEKPGYTLTTPDIPDAVIVPATGLAK
jgi:hypothetical protein